MRALSPSVLIGVGILWLAWGVLNPRFAGVWFALGAVFLVAGLRSRRRKAGSGSPQG
jgi:hypothetical protein